MQLLLSLLCWRISHAQKEDCNKSTWGEVEKKNMPKEVCIPKGHLISYVYKSSDVNGDGLNDYIFKWNKSAIKDGDTLFVTIYLQNKDSTFTLFHTFKNLYPIYFERYDLDYFPKDKSLNTLHKRYEGKYLMLKLTFNEEKIIIRRRCDATSEFFITYKYDKNIKNWIYEKCNMYDFSEESTKPYDLSEKLGPTIDNFTYFIWD